MVERGVVSIDDVMAAPRTKTQYETTVVVRANARRDASKPTLFARAPKRRALFEHLRPAARAAARR